MRPRQERGPALRRPLAALVLVACAAALAAVTLGTRQPAEAAGLPRCARTTSATGLVPGLASFPLPKGSVVEARRDRYGYAIFRGRVPGWINPVRDALLADAPRAGYRVTGGDSEAAEAEASFAGHGGRGRWKLRAMPGCPGALTIELAFRPG